MLMGTAPTSVTTMPELPEVETMRRGILPIVGSRLRVRMTARLLLLEPPDREHLRLIFDLSGGTMRQLPS